MNYFVKWHVKINNILYANDDDEKFVTKVTCVSGACLMSCTCGT